jgi:hypothetical protein
MHPRRRPVAVAPPARHLRRRRFQLVLPARGPGPGQLGLAGRRVAERRPPPLPILVGRRLGSEFLLMGAAAVAEEEEDEGEDEGDGGEAAEDDAGDGGGGEGGGGGRGGQGRGRGGRGGGGGEDDGEGWD